MRSKLKRLHYILFHSDVALAEFAFACISLAWGLWILMPWWDAFAASSSFRIMAEIAPEWVWGSAMALFGFLKIYFLASEQPRAERLVFLTSVFPWSCITISFMVVSPGAVGTAVYILITLFNVFFAIRPDRITHNAE